jgi:hypothetical protein
VEKKKNDCTLPNFWKKLPKTAAKQKKFQNVNTKAQIESTNYQSTFENLKYQQQMVP